ncbi:MAG: single-stranded DNA-binding protein [Bacteroidales bacterium]|nr:MAG: single-stranded DNA-binding protein [Bacteroidales bacterium]
MNNLRNRVNLIGNLGTDPEVRKLESGRTLAKFPLATSDSYKNAEGQKIKETQWHNLVIWGNTAIFAEKYLKKGNEIAVEGKLSHRSYEDKDGVKKYITEIIVNEILILRSQNISES